MDITENQNPFVFPGNNLWVEWFRHVIHFRGSNYFILDCPFTAVENASLASGEGPSFVSSLIFVEATPNEIACFFYQSKAQ